jgi:hypothetical protein
MTDTEFQQFKEKYIKNDPSLNQFNSLSSYYESIENNDLHKFIGLINKNKNDLDFIYDIYAGFYSIDASSIYLDKIIREDSQTKKDNLFLEYLSGYDMPYIEKKILFYKLYGNSIFVNDNMLQAVSDNINIDENEYVFYFFKELDYFAEMFSYETESSYYQKMFDGIFQIPSAVDLLVKSDVNTYLIELNKSIMEYSDKSSELKHYDYIVELQEKFMTKFKKDIIYLKDYIGNISDDEDKYILNKTLKKLIEQFNLEKSLMYVVEPKEINLNFDYEIDR